MALVGACALAACGGGPHRGLLPASWQVGVNVTAFTADAYGTPAGDAALRAARAAGATDVALVPTWYQTNATDSAVFADPARTPSDASIEHAALEAQRLGLRVTLKPQIDALDGTSRTKLAPASLDAWFASYRTMLERYTELATRVHAATLVVGVELTTMVGGDRDRRWRELIADVRALGFGGAVTFAANWDGLEAVGFWDALDYVGVDAYFPLIVLDEPAKRVPSTDQLAGAWKASRTVGDPRQRDWLAEITAVHDRYHKRVVFTELGYGSVECVNVTPYQLPPTCLDNPGPPRVSPALQANAYEAAYRVFSRMSWIGGIYWWDWPAGGYDPHDGAYSPRGKQAEAVLKRWSGF